jgi:hypothetical protein
MQPLLIPKFLIERTRVTDPEQVRAIKATYLAPWRKRNPLFPVGKIRSLVMLGDPHDPLGFELYPTVAASASARPMKTVYIKEVSA